MLFKVGKTTNGELVAYTDQEREKDFLQEIAEQIDEVIGRWPESFACPNMNEIHNGWEFTELYRFDTDSTYHIIPAQHECANARYDNCWNQFLEENNLPPETEYDDLTQEQQNEFSDYENE